MNTAAKATEKERDVLNKMMRSKIKSIIKSEAKNSLAIRLEDSPEYMEITHNINALYEDMLGELDYLQQKKLVALMDEQDSLLGLVKQNCIDLISYL